MEWLHPKAQNKGAIGELIVSADLMARGFLVFRAVSPYAPCDLVASVAGDLFRVEVKVADKNESGKFTRNLRLRDGVFDLLAVVSPKTWQINYEGRSSSLCSRLAGSFQPHKCRSQQSTN